MMVMVGTAPGGDPLSGIRSKEREGWVALVKQAVGIDIVDVEKVESMYHRWGERFLHRVLTDCEIEFCLSRHRVCESIAARIAAKEAFYKASGLMGYLPWRQIEVVKAGTEKPDLKLHGDLEQTFAGHNVMVSLSHSRNVAVAVVVVDTKGV